MVFLYPYVSATVRCLRSFLYTEYTCTYTLSAYGYVRSVDGYVSSVYISYVHSVYIPIYTECIRYPLSVYYGADSKILTMAKTWNLDPKLVAMSTGQCVYTCKTPHQEHWASPHILGGCCSASQCILMFASKRLELVTTRKST